MYTPTNCTVQRPASVNVPFDGQSDEWEAATEDGVLCRSRCSSSPRCRLGEELLTGGDTWLGTCRSSWGDVRVVGSYSSLALLEHLAGVHRTLRDERRRLLHEKEANRQWKRWLMWSVAAEQTSFWPREVCVSTFCKKRDGWVYYKDQRKETMHCRSEVMAESIRGFVFGRQVRKQSLVRGENF